MIAGKNSKTAGIVWYGFVETELRRKIGNARCACSQFSIGVGPVHVGLEFLVHSLHFADIVVVRSELEQTSLARELQHPDRIVVGSVPELRV